MEFLQQWLKALLEAKTELEFFLLVGQLQSRFERYGLWVKFSNNGPLTSPTLAAIIEQRICDTSQGRQDWEVKATHIFRLTHLGILEWEIVGRESIVGLQNIKARLQTERPTFVIEHLVGATTT